MGIVTDGKLKINPMAKKSLTEKDFLMQWRVHTPALLKEILNNPSTSALISPLNILSGVLQELVAVSQKINDDELNALMCRLTLFEESDPYSPHHNPELIRETIKKASQK